MTSVNINLQYRHPVNCFFPLKRKATLAWQKADFSLDFKSYIALGRPFPKDEWLILCVQYVKNEDKRQDWGFKDKT